MFIEAKITVVNYRLSFVLELGLDHWPCSGNKADAAKTGGTEKKKTTTTMLSNH